MVQQFGFKDEIELEVTKDGLLIRAIRMPRERWEDSFREMHRTGNDQLLDKADAHTETGWDRTEWTW